MIRLRLLVPGQEPLELGFDDPIIGIGRDQTNLIQVDDKRASRYHCQIEREDEHWKVVDNASANGTSVNGGQINFHRLAVGDRIAIGDTQVEVIDLAAGSRAAGRASRRAPAVGRGTKRGPALADEGARPRRHRSAGGSSQITAWVLAIIVCMLGAGVLIYNEAQNRFHSNSLQAARSAMREALFEDAVEHARKVPSGSRYHDEARSLIDEIGREKERFLENALEKQAAEAYARLEEFTTIKTTTRKQMRVYVDNFLKRYAGSSYSGRATALIDLVPEEEEEGGNGASTSTTTPRTTGTSDELSSLQRVMKEADGYVTNKKFGAAIEVLSDFWSEHTGADAEAANKRVTELHAQAAAEWEDLKFQIETHAKAGRKEKALELLWVAHGFGIESIVEAANRMTKELEKQ